MPSRVESIEISQFDPSHPALSPDPEKRPFSVRSVGVFAVIGTKYPVYVICHHKEGWSIPAGRVETTDQDPLDAAMREFFEETNGYFELRDVTHMGIVSRRSEDGELLRSLVFRAKINLYNLGIDHQMMTHQIAGVDGDQEVNFIMLIPINELPPGTIYREDISVPVVEAFSKIKD